MASVANNERQLRKELRKKEKAYRESMLGCPLQIDSKWYDVEAYIKHHPGEGIRGCYLRKFKGKNVDKQMQIYHTTNDPFLMLNAARDGNISVNIRYLPEGPEIKTEEKE